MASTSWWFISSGLGVEASQVASPVGSWAIAFFRGNLAWDWLCGWSLKLGSDMFCLGVAGAGVARRVESVMLDISLSGGSGFGEGLKVEGEHWTEDEVRGEGD